MVEVAERKNRAQITGVETVESKETVISVSQEG
jgi:hypothetical protein